MWLLHLAAILVIGRNEVDPLLCGLIWEQYISSWPSWPAKVLLLPEAALDLMWRIATT